MSHLPVNLLFRPALLLLLAAVALVLELLAAAAQRSLDPVRRAARTGEGEVSPEVSTLGQAGHEDG